MSYTRGKKRDFLLRVFYIVKNGYRGLFNCEDKQRDNKQKQDGKGWNRGYVCEKI